MFKQHLEMIGRNETPSKKAKFWQSYIRSLKGNISYSACPSEMQNWWEQKKYFPHLKGSDDIRAHDAPKTRPTWRSEVSPTFRSIYDEPATASERISGAGYRYLPVHRDTYGYSPRAIYTHHYNKPSKCWVTCLFVFCGFLRFVLTECDFVLSLPFFWLSRSIIRSIYDY